MNKVIAESGNRSYGRTDNDGDNGKYDSPVYGERTVYNGSLIFVNVTLKSSASRFVHKQHKKQCQYSTRNAA